MKEENMNKILTGILVLGLIFGTSAITRAAGFDIQFGDHHRDYGYNYGSNSYGDRDFGRWDARMRDRIQDAYRDQNITEYEYNKLNNELGNIESFHDQAFNNGYMSDRDRVRLHRMEARMDRDLDREVGEHMD